MGRLRGSFTGTLTLVVVGGLLNDVDVKTCLTLPGRASFQKPGDIKSPGILRIASHTRDASRYPRELYIFIVRLHNCCTNKDLELVVLA